MCSYIIFFVIDEVDISTVAHEQPVSSSEQNHELGADHDISNANMADNENSNAESNDLTTNNSGDAEILQGVPASDENDDAQIVQAVLKAFGLAEEMSASQKNLMDIIQYERDLYCQGNSEKLNRWPSNYAACLQVLRNAGYKDPIIYRICLNEAHHNLWSINHPLANCQYCGQQGSIMHYYLSLADKVKRWCFSEEFCYKMTAHWRERVTWMNLGNLDNHLMNETKVMSSS